MENRVVDIFKYFGVDKEVTNHVLAQMGNHMFQTMLIATFLDKPATQPGDIAELLRYKSSVGHVVEYLKEKIPTISIVGSTRVMTAFYTALASTGSCNTTEKIVRDIIKFEPGDKGDNRHSYCMSVEEYNEAVKEGRHGNKSVKLTYCTGTGRLMEAICVPRGHKGYITLTRTTRTAASRTATIAVWTCCGKALAETSSNVRGYEIIESLCDK
jgi:hypothetical protein